MFIRAVIETVPIELSLYQRTSEYPSFAILFRLVSNTDPSLAIMSDNAAAPTQPAETSGSPAEFLKNVVGKEVKVRIGQGIDYQGKPSITMPSSFADPCRNSGNLSCLDGYMNVAMENTKEMVDGKVTASFGDAFIRGNNGECFDMCRFRSCSAHIACSTSVLYISAMEDI